MISDWITRAVKWLRAVSPLLSSSHDASSSGERVRVFVEIYDCLNIEEFMLLERRQSCPIVTWTCWYFIASSSCVIFNNKTPHVVRKAARVAWGECIAFRAADNISKYILISGGVRDKDKRNCRCDCGSLLVPLTWHWLSCVIHCAFESH